VTSTHHGFQTSDLALPSSRNPALTRHTSARNNLVTDLDLRLGPALAGWLLISVRLNAWPAVKERSDSSGGDQPATAALSFSDLCTGHCPRTVWYSCRKRRCISDRLPRARYARSSATGRNHRRIRDCGFVHGPHTRSVWTRSNAGLVEHRHSGESFPCIRRNPYSYRPSLWHVSWEPRPRGLLKFVPAEVARSITEARTETYTARDKTGLDDRRRRRPPLTNCRAEDHAQ